MTNETQLRLLALITTPKLAEKAEELFRRGKVPLQYRLHAEGTASSEILELLGLGGTERAVLLGLLPHPFAREMLKKLQAELKLSAASGGIACTAAISGASSPLFHLLTGFGGSAPKQNEREKSYMSDNRHSMILTVVEQGYSELVMEAARPAGATGGTVINSRWLPDEETVKFWNISVQQEKEIVVIIADDEKKHAIMQAISEQCGVRSEAKGVVASVPIEDVIGI